MTTMTASSGASLEQVPPVPAVSAPAAPISPAAWAVTAFGSTSLMLGIYNAGLMSSKSAMIVVPVALFFGGIPQILVAIIEAVHGNVFGAVVFGTYGPFWIIYGTLQTLFATSIPPAEIGHAIALLEVVFAIVSFYLLIAALKTDAVLVAIFVLIVIGLTFLAIGAGSANADMTKIGGWCTLAFAVLALYHAAGDVISATFGRQILPMFPLA